jgi:HK97 family phage major capsid protein
VNDEFAKRVGKRATGFWVPGDVLLTPMSQRSLNATTATQGGFTVNVDAGGQSMIELLRNRMVTSRMGARVLSGLTGNVAIPRQTSASTTYWLAEVEEVTESEQAFGQIAFTPKAISCNTTYSKELLLQSSIDIEGFVRDDLVTTIALERDRVYLHGSGVAGQPLGIAQTTGINTVTYGGAATWAKVVESETKLAEDNVAFVRPGWIVSPGTRAKWKTIEKFASTGVTLWSDNSTVSGYQAEVTNQVAGNVSFFVDWNDFIIAEWGGIDVVVDPYTMAKTRKIGITISEWVDCGLRHAVSACVSTDTAAA